MKLSRLLLVIGVLLVLGISGYFLFKHYSHPKTGWKNISGCVSENSIEYNYSFNIKENWQLISTDFGCGKEYENAQTYGILDADFGDRIEDVSQVAIALYGSKPSSYNSNEVEYFSITDGKNVYLEFARISVNNGDMEYKISDEEWDYIKDSFRFI